MRLLITGGTGVLGRVLLPLAEDAGHEVFAPGRRDLDLFSRAARRVEPARGDLRLCRDGEDVSNARLSAAAGWRPRN
jgi:nucleoside-diphosphate-sugar epimerase